MSRALATAGDGAAYGATGGFLSGEGQGRLTGAAEGAAMGGAIGGVVPLAGAAATGNPIVSQISARMNPQGFATSQRSRAFREWRDTWALQDALTDAAAAGQPHYALADALGNSGQRMLTTVTKSPGIGRTEAQQFLDARQAGQSADVSSQLADALGAHGTAAGTVDALTAQRAADAALNYGAARASGGAVDVTPAIQLADQTLQPGVTGLMSPQSGIDPNSITAIVAKAKGYLTDGQSQISEFGHVCQAKQEIDNLIFSASPQQQRALIPIKTLWTTNSPRHRSLTQTLAIRSPR